MRFLDFNDLLQDKLSPSVLPTFDKTSGISGYLPGLIHASVHVTIRQFSKLHDAYVGCGLGCSQWLVGDIHTTTPELREQNESIEQIQGYLTRQNTARALRRSNTDGC